MNSQLNQNGAAEKPYPRRCAECGEMAVQAAKVSYDAKIKHDGKVHEFHIPELPVDRCSACSELFFTNETSDAKVFALRQQLGLLQSHELRSLLAQHHLTQRKFAEQLGIAEETVSRWLNGLSIQTRALDTLMRVFFAVPQARDFLSQNCQPTSNDPEPSDLSMPLDARQDRTRVINLD